MPLFPLPCSAAGPALAETSTSQLDRAGIDKIIAEWPNRPKLGAQQMLDKYGVPQEATSEQLIWHDQGPFKLITVTKAEHPHDFPKPHMDFMQHTINYAVPAEKAEALSAYDGSLTFDRTKGEMAARCDLEGHNILTLNLAHDIVNDKLNADQAREEFGKNVVADMKGAKPPAYVAELQFKPKTEGVAFADVPVIPGSSKRPDGMAKVQGDKENGEVLGFVGAVSENEIIAAIAASKEDLDPQVAEYAKMLHTGHGKNLEETMKLGQQIKVTPLETKDVDKLRVKGAGELAKIVPLDGKEFSEAYMLMMIKGHTDVIEMIDGKLLPEAGNEELKAHLTKTRADVAEHLEEAKKIEADLKK